MKYLKRFFSIGMAVVMMLSMTISAFAANENPHTITITHEKSGHVYEAYQVFKGDISDDKLTNVEWGNGVNGEALLVDLKQMEDSPYMDCNSAEAVADVLETMSENSAELDAFATVAGKHLTTEASVSTNAGTVEKDGIAYYKYDIQVTGDGYYLVKDQGTKEIEDGDAYTKYILKVVGDVLVEAKADAPELEKKIVEGEKKVDANNGSVGDTVNYELTSRVPDMDGYDKYDFIVHDTLSEGLTFQEDSVRIQVGNTVLSAEDYSVVTENVSDDCIFEIILKDFYNKYKEQSGAKITMKYSAIINENAIVGNVGNSNEAYLEYSNHPYEGVNGITPKDIVLTYVTGIELIKIDENGNRLTGAEFQITGDKLNKVQTMKEVFQEDPNGIFYKLKKGTYTDIAPTEETAGDYANTEITYGREIKTEWNISTEAVSATATVGSDGVVRFDGLSEGTYVIKEMKAPSGYNLLKEDITVKISCEEPATVLSGEEKAVWKYTLSGAVSTENNEVTATSGRVELTIENKEGATLPSTGGIGTTIFYILGAILTVGGGAILLTKKYK